MLEYLSKSIFKKKEFGYFENILLKTFKCRAMIEKKISLTISDWVWPVWSPIELVGIIHELV